MWMSDRWAILVISSEAPSSSPLAPQRSAAKYAWGEGLGVRGKAEVDAFITRGGKTGRGKGADAEGSRRERCGRCRDAGEVEQRGYWMTSLSLGEVYPAVVSSR